MRRKKVAIDMLTGKPLKSIIRFMIPILIGNAFQQLYSMVDTIIVGQALSNEALAGVGATGAMAFLIIGFVQGLCAGVTVITSQCFGARDEALVRRSVATSFMICAAFTVFITIISVVSAMPLLRLMRTPSDIIDYSYDYVIIICGGIGATMIYNIGACILRALGDSKTPLIFLIIASVLNVVLDLLFICVFKMGVAGAGIATVVSQLLSGVACIIFMLYKFPILRLKKQDFKVAWRFMFRHIAVAMPMALQFSIIAIGIMVQQSALNNLGSVVVAAYSAANKIDQFSTQILLSLGMALAVYCGQNFGAGNLDRIKVGVNQTAVLSVVCSVAVGAFVIFLAKPLTRLFISGITDEILDLSQKFLFYQGVFYSMLAGIFVYRNALQGMGYSIFTVIACAIELVMRILASILLARVMGFTGICLSNPVAWVGATVMLIVAYYMTMGKLLKKSPLKALESKGEQDATVSTLDTPNTAEVMPNATAGVTALDSATVMADVLTADDAEKQSND